MRYDHEMGFDEFGEPQPTRADLADEAAAPLHQTLPHPSSNRVSVIALVVAVIACAGLAAALIGQSTVHECPDKPSIPHDSAPMPPDHESRRVYRSALSGKPTARARPYLPPATSRPTPEPSTEGPTEVTEAPRPSSTVETAPPPPARSAEDGESEFGFER